MKMMRYARIGMNTMQCLTSLTDHCLSWIVMVRQELAGPRMKHVKLVEKAGHGLATLIRYILGIYGSAINHKVLKPTSSPGSPRNPPPSSPPARSRSSLSTSSPPAVR